MKKSELTLKDLPYSQAKRVIEIYEESPFDIRKNDLFVDRDDVEEHMRDAQVEYAESVLTEIKHLVSKHASWISDIDSFLIGSEEYADNQSYWSKLEDYADEYILTDKEGQDFTVYVLK